MNSIDTESTSDDLSQLIQRVKSDFDIKCESIQFGQRTIEFYQPADPEAVLDDETLLSSHGQLDWQPYWAQAWDASLGMCQHLSRQPVNGTHVLDLGCGIGLTSAMLLSCGASVVCGDNAPPSLLFTEINTWPWREHCEIQLIDWHKTNTGHRFDTIVGSDIVYDRDEVGPLDFFFRRHLNPDGQILLSDPSRPMTREYLTAFANLGWQMDEQTIEVAEIKPSIRIVTMRL